MRSAGARDAGPAPQPRAVEQVRNIALVGPTGAGKTTLLEALLLRAGAVARAGTIAAGTTTSDSAEVETRQGRSVFLAAASFEHAGVKLNVFDTPGHADFVGELRAGLRAADAVLFVLSAVAGVDAPTAQLWEECADAGLPRAVVITQLDRPRADFDESVALAQRLFGDGVQPLYLPMHGDDDSVAGLIGLLSQRVRDWSTGEPVDRDPDPQHLPLIESVRAALLEGIIAESEDESLMDRYLAGEHVETDVLVRDLETAVARGSFYPVLAATPLTGLGTDELLEVLTRGFPSPAEHDCPTVTRPDGTPAAPVFADPGGPLVAEVVRTDTDPYLGRISLVRVFSGTLRPDQQVHVSGHGGAERGHPDHDDDLRIGALSSPLGAALRQVSHCPAGDVCVVAKLAAAETGDTLSAADEPLLVHAWDLPEPQLPIAVEARSHADEDKLGAALSRLAAEDRTVRVERVAETGQLLLWCIGDAHAEVLLDRLRHRYGVAVDTTEVRVPLRETLSGPVTVTARHVKQSGGHGQFAVAVLELSPLPTGSGVEFGSEVVGGAVPTAYVASVENGVRSQLASGVHEGRPVVDVRARLLDGKAHAVDSSDAAFHAAGALAVREAVAAGTTVLEPVSRLAVTVPAAFVGTVMSDLSGRRARVIGSEPAGEHDDRTVIRAEVPELALLRYAAELRALTHGTGTCVRRYLGHEPMA